MESLHLLTGTKANGRCISLGDTANPTLIGVRGRWGVQWGAQKRRRHHLLLVITHGGAAPEAGQSLRIDHLHRKAMKRQSIVRTKHQIPIFHEKEATL